MTFYTNKDIPQPRYDRDYSFEDKDWFVGSKKRFKYSIEWVESDDITEFMYIQDNDIPRVEVRKWCEDNCCGDVLALEKSNTIFSQKRGFQVRRQWVEFCFELDTDATAFKLKWL